MLQINVNRNIDDYKESVIAGFSARETLFIGVGLMASVSCMLILTLFLHIPLVMAMYGSLPACIPFVLTGFFSKDGMSYWQRKKLQKIRKQMQPLSYVSTESSYEFTHNAKNAMVELSEEEQELQFEKIFKRIKIGIGIFVAIFVIAIVVAIVLKVT